MKKPQTDTPIHQHIISGCSFTGVHYDRAAVESIQTLAEAARDNARAIAGLAAVFDAKRITIPTLLNIEATGAAVVNSHLSQNAGEEGVAVVK